MKTNELTGIALDLAVAICEGIRVQTDGDERLTMRSNLDYWQPSTDWAQGGAIIEREEMTIEHTVDVNKTYWKAWCWIDGEDAQAYGYGKTPLVAAMRCYVASKLGDEVEVPEELMTTA